MFLEEGEGGRGGERERGEGRREGRRERGREGEMKRECVYLLSPSFPGFFSF